MIKPCSANPVGAGRSEEQVLASIEKSIAVVTQVIANTATPVVETEVMSAIEESVNETVDEVEQLVGNSVQIGLTFHQ